MASGQNESQVYTKLKNQLNIAGIGLPGSGKGTQGTHLKNKYGLQRISTGDLLRWHMRQGTEIGKQAKQYVEAGKLVPDEIIAKIYSDELLKPDFSNGHFGDGAGRTLGQYKAYETMFGEDFYDGALFFNLHPDIVRSRLLGRLVCSECGTPYSTKTDGVVAGDPCREENCKGILQPRADDNQEVIENRISEFEKNSPPYIDHLRSKEKLWEVPMTAETSPQHVSAMVDEYVCAAKAKQLRQEILGVKRFYNNGLSASPCYKNNSK